MTRRRNTAIALSSPLLIAAVAAVFVAAYLGFWWVRADSVNRTAEIRQDSYGRQVALVDQVLDDIAEAEDPAIPPTQRSALVAGICRSADLLTGSVPLPNHATRFILKECPQ